MRFQVIISTLIFALAIVVTAIFMRPSRAGRNRQLFRHLCQMVAEQIYLPDKTVHPWTENCLLHANRSGRAGIQQFIDLFNQELNGLKVSHLLLVRPDETQRLWDNQGLDTGLRARLVDGEWVVFEVIGHSPAEMAGFQLGDLIRKVNGEPVNRQTDIMTTTGMIEFERAGLSHELRLNAAALKLDNRPILTAINAHQGYLRIPDFLANHFEKSDWMSLAKKIEPLHHLIIDVRDNDGGNFIALLRVLSTLMCQPKKIGDLLRPKSQLDVRQKFPDELDDSVQSNIVHASREIYLSTFAGYGCYRGAVTVLANENTASVAEIFAQALKYRPHSQVWGAQTSGQVVLAEWYPLEELGLNYELSIPEAVFQDNSGFELEGKGVRPDKYLTYDLDEAKRGTDSWIRAAIELGPSLTQVSK